MSDAERDRLRLLLTETPECPTLNELLAARESGALETAHERNCPRCQAELALFAAFQRAPGLAERKTVDSLASRLGTVNWQRAADNMTIERPSWWKRWFQNGFLVPASIALACSLVLISVIQVNHRTTLSSEIHVRDSEPVRSQDIEALAPLGTVGSAPQDLRWKPVSGASAYRVRLMEVDRTVLWEGSVSGDVAALPSAVVSRIVPGKRLLWEVTALSSSGIELAQSGLKNFTVNLH